MLSRMLGYVPGDELGPDGSAAYFEHTGGKHVAECLRKAAVPSAVRVAIGIIRPRPDRYHVPLASLPLDRRTSRERVCVHTRRRIWLRVVTGGSAMRSALVDRFKSMAPP